MTLQRVFSVFMGPVWLASAAFTGTVAADEYAKNHKTDPKLAAEMAVVTTPFNPEPAPIQSIYIGTSINIPAYDNHRYRNGGHFGSKNSDEYLENGGN